MFNCSKSLVNKATISVGTFINNCCRNPKLTYWILARVAATRILYKSPGEIIPPRKFIFMIGKRLMLLNFTSSNQHSRFPDRRSGVQGDPLTTHFSPLTIPNSFIAFGKFLFSCPCRHSFNKAKR